MKYSKQRESILRALAEKLDHPTAEMVYQAVKLEQPNISLGTIYRNLNQLAEQGMLRRISTPFSGDRFDIRTAPHAHLLCTCCGRMLDLEEDLLDAIDQKVLDTAGFQVQDHQLLLSGTCSCCMAQSRRDVS